MKYLNLFMEVAATTAKDIYFPVPCRGTIAGVKAVYSEETDEDETLTFARGSDATWVVTPPADATAEGVEIDGVADSSNSQLVFDPDSSTASHKVIKVSVPNTFDSAGTWGITISFDDSAAVTQTASEA